MLTPLSWLRDFAPFDLDPGDLGRVFDDLGMVVEGIERVGEGLDGVVLGRVLEVSAIEGARVRRTRVDLGDEYGRDVQIVCGAANVQAGQLVPVAVVGAVLPGNFAIGARTVLGVASNGMICSAVELGLGADADGIMVLDPDLGAPGQPFAAAAGIDTDVVYDLAIETNRPDANCIAGIARDAAARLGLPFAIPIPPALPTDLPAPPTVPDVACPELAPRFGVAVLEGARVGPSPAWMARRLTLAGMRPISNLVDISNYVMLELGQPTHPYDLDLLPGGGLGVRRAEPGEALTTLDDVERRLGDGPSPDVVITDGEGTPVGIAGIMGGASSEVHDGTTRVLLEAAHFDRLTIAKSSKRLGLRSEASARFERGVDPCGIERAIARYAELAGGGGTPSGAGASVSSERAEAGGAAFGPIGADVGRSGGAQRSWVRSSGETPETEVGRSGAPNAGAGSSGGVPGAGVDPSGGALVTAFTVIESPEHVPVRRPINVRTAQVNGLLGTALDDAAVAGLLRPIGFLAELVEPGSHRVTPPSFRLDAEEEVDVVEEVARHLSYSAITPTVPASPLVGGLSAHQRSRRHVREVLAGLGCTEAATGLLLGPGDHQRAGLGGLEAGALRAVDPLVKEESVLRRSLLPGLLAAVAFNLDRRQDRVHLFEIGTVFSPSDGGRPVVGVDAERWLPDEPEMVTVVLAGSGADAVTAARVWGSLAGALRLAGAALVATADAAGLHPTRTAAVVGAGGEPIGAVGEVDPDVLSGLGIAGRVGVVELDLHHLLAEPRHPDDSAPVSRFPSSDVDLAFSVPEDVPARDVEATLRQASGALLEQIALFDAYRGAELPEGTRSLAFHLRYTAPDRTLTDADVAAARRAGIDAVTATHGATLR